MKFLYERQTRRFFGFLAGVLMLQTGLLGLIGFLQVRELQRFLAERDLAAVSYLLKQEIPPAVVASVWNQKEITEEGIKLLHMTGHTEQTSGWFWLIFTETSALFLFCVVSAGILSAAVILGGAALFFRRRERVYEEAEQVVSAYARNRFEKHLPVGQTGALYQLFGSIEQLALSLQARSEMEHRAKIFLRNMISNISHQLKTPLAALSMYMEIILEEPGQEEIVCKFSRKSLQSVDRMEQLIQSLLKMARLDTGTIVFEKKRCQVLKLVEKAAGDLKERAEREDKKILTEGPKEKTLKCDPEWTREAIGNLIKNALDHTKESSVYPGNRLREYFVCLWRTTGVGSQKRTSIIFSSSSIEAVHPATGREQALGFPWPKQSWKAREEICLWKAARGREVSFICPFLQICKRAFTKM